MIQVKDQDFNQGLSNAMLLMSVVLTNALTL